MTKGTVLAIERCSLHDGPGLRTTVFLKGCPLSCIWCHNPESQSFNPEIYYFDEKCTKCSLCTEFCKNHNVNESKHLINRKDCIFCGKCVSTCPQSAIEMKGKVMTTQDVMDIVLKDEKFYKQSGGGLTLSGGEPLSQFDFTYEILRLAKENSINTCLETSGYAPADMLLSLIPFVDLFLYDFKEYCDEEHLKFTGVSRSLIIENLFILDKTNAKIILRCPVIPSCNDNEKHFEAITQTANALKNIIEVNIMPYHPMGASKAVRIGREFAFSDSGFPTEDQINNWLKIISNNTNVKVEKG